MKDLTEQQLKHELRKAHKGLRRKDCRSKKMEDRIDYLEHRNFQLTCALAYTSGDVRVIPYRGWDSDIQWWIDKYESKQQRN